MLFRKKPKKKTWKTARKSVFDFINFPILILTIISFFFILSFTYEWLISDSRNPKNINLQEILDSSKNSYEKETGHRIQLEVLNGCGQMYIAVMYQDFLREQGFDVMDAKNANSFDFQFSKIIIYKDDIKMAKFLSEIMGVHDSLIVEDYDKMKVFDMSIIIGKDFKDLISYDKASIHYPIF